MNYAQTFNGVPKRFIIAPTWDYLHVFTDNQDVVFNTKELGYGEARKQAFLYRDKLIAEGCERIRVYAISEWQDFRDGSIECDKEECLYALGEYPY